jgi:hypothetical protein
MACHVICVSGLEQYRDAIKGLQEQLAQAVMVDAEGLLASFGSPSMISALQAANPVDRPTVGHAAA